MNLIKPMNACPLENRHVEILQDLSYIAQEKLKGIRALIYFTSPKEIKIITRGLKDITSKLIHLHALAHPYLVGTVLDCEIYTKGVDDAIIAGMVNRKEWHEENSSLKPYIFDMLFLKERDITYLLLKERLEHLHELACFLPYFQELVLPTFEGSKDEKLLFYSQVVKDGGEGIMLKNLRSSYIIGKRPQGHWYKMKKTEIYDVIIMGFIEGKGKYKGQVGAIIFGRKEGNNLIPIGKCSGITDELRKEMSLNPEKFIGKTIEVEASDWTKDGALENPRFLRFKEE